MCIIIFAELAQSCLESACRTRSVAVYYGENQSSQVAIHLKNQPIGPFALWICFPHQIACFKAPPWSRFDVHFLDQVCCCRLLNNHLNVHLVLNALLVSTVSTAPWECVATLWWGLVCTGPSMCLDLLHLTVPPLPQPPPALACSLLLGISSLPVRDGIHASTTGQLTHLSLSHTHIHNHKPICFLTRACVGVWHFLFKTLSSELWNLKFHSWLLLEVGSDAKFSVLTAA